MVGFVSGMYVVWMLLDVSVVMGECVGGVCGGSVWGECVVGFVSGIFSVDVSRCECSDGESVWWVL